MTLQGKYIFDAIKLHINKYRLTTNHNLLNNKERISEDEINSLLTKLYLSDSPYEIKNGVRYIRNTNNFVSKIGIIARHENYNNLAFASISECAKSFNVSSNEIKECLKSNKSIRGYYFVLS